MTKKANIKTNTQKNKPAPGKKTQSAAQTVETADTDLNEVDKIRDIIFGAQMATYENRFAQLEDRIRSQIEALHQETAEQVKQLEVLIHQNQEAQGSDLETERVERGKSEHTLSREVADADKRLNAAIETLSARQVQDIQNIQEQLTAVSGNLTDELHNLQMETAKNLEQALQGLDDDKLARQALSQLLHEMADRL